MSEQPYPAPTGRWDDEQADHQPTVVIPPLGDHTAPLPPVREPIRDEPFWLDDGRAPYQQQPYQQQPYPQQPYPQAYQPAPITFEPARRRLLTGNRALAVMAVVAAVLGFVAVGLLRGSGAASLAGRARGTTSSSSSSSQGAAAPGGQVPGSRITASASSEQSADGSVTYGAGNTLDGVRTTAWNSDGFTGALTLTYRFDAPVHLTALTVLNGYDKRLSGQGQGGPRDLWRLNSRAQRVTVVTDSGSTGWTLRDTRAEQTLTRDLGTTRQVQLRIESIYPGAKYQDVAISEVSFSAKG